MKIAAIMPCRGRAEQTVTNVRRLLATAGYEEWRLICVVGGEPGLAELLMEATRQTGDRLHIYQERQRLTYWQALEKATTFAHGATHLVNLANDLLPGMHWLRRAMEAYQATFSDGPGLLGFNGDSHEIGHSCHFLIARSLLERYGGWPTWYDHNYGDTELCQRAIADGLYAKAPWALLYHDHPYWGGQDDDVYAAGRETMTRDQRLFEQRRRAGWSTQPGTR